MIPEKSKKNSITINDRKQRRFGACQDGRDSKNDGRSEQCKQMSIPTAVAGSDVTV